MSESYKIDQKTTVPSKEKIQKNWVLIDAEGVALGRLASRAATILKGKNKPYYTPFLDCGDNVVVINAAKVAVSGNKLEQKLYRRYSGFPGGMTIQKMSNVMQSDATIPVKEAVKGMLPKTKLGRKQLKNLRVFTDANHDLASQKPVKIEI